MAFAFPGPLYPIADPAGAPDRTHLELVTAILSAGVRLVQLRVKNAPTRTSVEFARAARALTARVGALLIINDRADIARLIDADGVHVGQDDLSPADARTLLGPGKIIGLSTHTAAQVRSAEQEGTADYLAFGPIFPTLSKQRADPQQGLDGLRAVRRITRRPLVAIGGIDAETLVSVLQAGADAVAVIGAIARAAEPQAATRMLHARALAVRAHPARRQS